MRSAPVSELGRCRVDWVTGIVGAAEGIAAGGSREVGSYSRVAGEFCVVASVVRDLLSDPPH
jgi:hypothetical protein